MLPVNLSHYLAVILSASLPVSEIRGALPLGVLIYHLPFWQVFSLAFLFNTLACVLFFFFLKYFSKYLRQKIKILDKFLNFLFARTHKKFYNKHKALGDFALLTFIAIPFPLTGGYTGAMAAFLFNISTRRALPLLAGGILIAGIIVTLVTLGIHHIF